MAPTGFIRLVGHVVRRAGINGRDGVGRRVDVHICQLVGRGGTGGRLSFYLVNAGSQGLGAIFYSPSWSKRDRCIYVQIFDAIF